MVPFAAVLGRDSQACHPWESHLLALVARQSPFKPLYCWKYVMGPSGDHKYFGFSNKIALPPFCALTELRFARQAVAGVITHGAAVGKELALHPQLQPKFS